MIPRSPTPDPETAQFGNEADIYPGVIRLPRQALPGIEAGVLGEDSGDEEAVSGLFREIAVDLALHDVEQELESAVGELSPELSGLSDPEVQDEMLEREKPFFTRVYAAAMDMAESQPGPITLLFDMDYTVVQHDSYTVRPAFGLVVRELDDVLGDRLQLGILSSRPRSGGQGRPENAPDDPIARTPAAGHKLNPDFLFSSLDLERSDGSVRPLVYGQDTAAQIEAARDVLDPEVIEAVEQGRLSPDEFYDTKLIILQGLVSKHPDRGFIVVDDFPYASAIRRDRPDLKGVRVNEEILDGTLRPYREDPRMTGSEESRLLAA